MGNCIGRIYPFDDCDSCQDHRCDVCSRKLLMMGSALSKYEKRLDDEEAAREDGDTKLQENLDKEIADREAAIAELEETTNANLEEAKQELQTNIDNEVTRAKAAEQTLQSNIDKEVQDRIADVNAEETRATEAEKVLQSNIDTEVNRAKAAEQSLRDDLNTETSNRQSADKTLQTNIDNEKNARIEADSDLSQRIENLEGKTTRLFYGSGTLSSPTATEIQSFIDGLDVEPPYAPPYSGIAIVVYLTDEKTYHIWHYYTNLSTWKDDGIDTVTTFTNTAKGIIQGSTNEGYISSDNGLGKVNGFSELKTQVGNNYDALNTKIEEETTRATGVEQSLRNDLTAEVSRAKAAEEKLTTDLTTEVDRATGKETEIEANLTKEIQDRTSADETLKTNIENGTIVANKATNDSDGNPINTTYVKVEGFKTNYLDSNNVMYKDDIQVLDKVNTKNESLSGLNIKGVNYNMPRLNLVKSDVGGYLTYFLQAELNLMDGVTSLSEKFITTRIQHESLLISGALNVQNFNTPISIEDATLISPQLTFDAMSDGTNMVGNISKTCILGADIYRAQGGIAESVIINNSATFRCVDKISNFVYIGNKYHSSSDRITKAKDSVVIGNINLSDDTQIQESIVISSSSANPSHIDSPYIISIGRNIRSLDSYTTAIGFNIRGAEGDNTDSILIGQDIETYNSNNCIVLGNKTIGLENDKAHGGYIFVDGYNSENKTLVLRSPSHILFRGADVKYDSKSLNDFPNRKTLYEYLSEKVNTTTTINGHPLSANVTITKSDVGLGNVVNTGDSATPVSGGTTKFTTGGAYTLQQTLQGNIDTKQDALTAGEGISITDNTISCTVSSPITATDVVIDLK